MSTNNAATFGVTVLAALAFLIGACGGTDYSGAAQTSSPAQPPARTTEPTSAPTSVAATATVPTSDATATPAQLAEITLVASSVRFEQRSLAAPAGDVTIAFDNRDQGVSHNVHVFRGNDTSGDDIGSTEIEAGAIQQTLVLGDLAPGSYFYQCDVHPAQMMGTLTVS
jgi:plastocyanin